jgi:membrane-anchored glycerophosphoryl diester phosphodiesterase (GDPDase)
MGVLLFFWLVVLALIAPIVVLEKQTASGAIRRAWDLARRRFWWVIGFMFILYIFGQFVVSGPVALINFAFQLTLGDIFTPSSSQLIMQSVLQSLVTLIFSLLYLPLQLTATTLLYFDLRIRTEGFDLKLLTSSLSDEAVDVDEVLAEAPQPERDGFITWTELGYFALLSIGVVILYLLLGAIVAAIGFAFMAAAGSAF